MVIMPVIVGVFKFKTINRGYIFLFFSLSVDFLIQILIKFFSTPIAINIAQYIYFIITFYLLLEAFLFFLGVKNKNKIIFLFLILTIISTLIEIKIVGISTFRVSLVDIFYQIVLFSIASFYLFRNLSETLNSKYRLSSLLIYVSYIVTWLYTIIFQIFILYLFSKETEQYFKNLSWVLNIIYFSTYICLTIAFIYAPKKEKYLS